MWHICGIVKGLQIHFSATGKMLLYRKKKDYRGRGYGNVKSVDVQDYGPISEWTASARS